MELLERLCINKYVILFFFSFTTEKKNDPRGHVQGQPIRDNRWRLILTKKHCKKLWNLKFLEKKAWRSSEEERIGTSVLFVLTSHLGIAFAQHYEKPGYPASSFRATHRVGKLRINLFPYFCFWVGKRYKNSTLRL